MNYVEGAATFSQKRFKVGSNDGDSDILAARVVDHPYREQCKFSVGTAKGLGTLGQFKTFAKS